MQMFYSDSIVDRVRNAFDRERHHLDQASFTQDQFLVLLSKLAASLWRPIGQTLAAADSADVETLLSLGQKLDAFLRLSVDFQFLRRGENGQFQFMEPEVHASLAASDFIRVLTDEDSDRGFIRDRLANALEQIGEPAVPLLLEALGNKDGGVNLCIAVILQRMGPPAVPALTRALRMGNRTIRRWVINALSSRENANAALPQLIALLNDEDQLLVRAGAVIALGASLSVEAEPALVAALNDSDPMVRSLAESALKDFDSPRARRALDDHRRVGPGAASPSNHPDRRPGSEARGSASRSTLDAPRVFLSYPREDTGRVEDFRRLLKLAGFDPWIDSEGLLAGEKWESRLLDALRASDFVVGFLSQNTPGGYQVRELRIALENAPTQRAPQTPFVLPCVIESGLFNNRKDAIPDFLREVHAMNLTNTDEGWKELHRSLCHAARSAGLNVPILLRSKPRHDLDNSAANRMIVDKNFFDSQRNQDGRAAASTLRPLPDATLVEDPVTGRIWTRGCIQELPKSPPPSLDDRVAEFTPGRQQEAVAKAENAARVMRLAINEWVERFNAERVGGYEGWRLPTLEEAMSLMTPEVRTGGLHIPEIFSDHLYVRTCDGDYHSHGIRGEVTNGYTTVWVACYGDGDAQEIPEQAAIPFRLVRTGWDH